MIATLFMHFEPHDVVDSTLVVGPAVAVNAAWLNVFVKPSTVDVARRFADALNAAADQMEAAAAPELEAFAAVEGDL